MFLETGQRKFSQTFGLYPTLWSVADLFCRQNALCIAFVGGSAIVVIVASYFFLLFIRRSAPLNVMEAFAAIIPISLLITYNWSYDQILLIVSIIFCAQSIAENNQFMSQAFPILIDSFSLMLLAWASFHGNDVGSVLLPAVLAGFTYWFLISPAFVQKYSPPRNRDSFWTT